MDKTVKESILRRQIDGMVFYKYLFNEKKSIA
jgi:hypothetical protein